MSIKTIFFSLVMAMGLGWVLFRDELEKEQTKFDSSYIFPYNPAPPFIIPSVYYQKNDTVALRLLEVKHMLSSSYPVLYAGRYKDSISAYKDPEGRYSLLGKPGYDYRKYSFFKSIHGRRGYSGPITFNCSVLVDTSTIFEQGSGLGFRGENYQSHPVYIINTYVYALVMESNLGGFLMILEAKDKNNVWRPIEQGPIGGCGLSGNSNVVLLPGDIGATIVPVLTGPFKTKLRLKIENGGPPDARTVYSNEFDGGIHLSQFEKNY